LLRFPDVFDHMVDRLRDFVVPYQHALETEAGKRHLHLYLVGLLSHLDRKNAEKIAALVDVKRLVMQGFIDTAPWDHRPLIKVLVGQVVDQLGEPNGVIAFDPSSFPKRGTHSVGVKRQWYSHRGKVDNCQVGVYMGYVSRHDHALLDFRLSLPQEWARDEQRRQECHVPEAVSYRTRHEQCLEMFDLWGEQVPHGWVWYRCLLRPECTRALSFMWATVYDTSAPCARATLHLGHAQQERPPYRA
jgi:SRSO17 transposase